MRVNFAREFDGSRTIKSTTFGRRSPFQYRIPRNRSKTSRSTASTSPTSRKKIPARSESQPKFPPQILYAEKKRKKMRERESRTVQLPRVAACRADSADAPNARDEDDDIDAARLARSRRGSSRGNSEHFFSLESEEKEREKRVRYFSFWCLRRPTFYSSPT